MFRLATVLLLSPTLFAAPITVTSYTAPAGDPGSFTYQDTGGTELTDGLYGVIPFGDQTQADPWIGWLLGNHSNPLLTFNFGGPVNITQVDLDLARWGSALIFLPASIDIGGTLFPLTGTELADSTRGTLSFAVNFVGVSSLNIQLTHGGTYLFLDEAKFFGSAAGGVPEPGSAILGGLGLCALAIVRRRVRRSQP